MILHLYFARRYALMLALVGTALSLIYLMLDTVEHIRRFALGPVEILRLSLLHLPGAVYQILPLVVILASVFLFLALARSSELVVTRAAGRAVLVALLAPATVVLLVGALALTLLNPIAAATAREYARLIAQHGQAERSALSISAEGLWLRQGDERGQVVIRAQHLAQAGPPVRLVGVSFFMFGPDWAPTRRIEAKSAELGSGRWALRDAKIWRLEGTSNPERAARQVPVVFVRTTLRPEDITKTGTADARIALWDLPSTIARLEKAGFSPRRYEAELQAELAMPLFLLSMLLIGAAFTMRPARFGHTGLMVLSALLLGFGLYFVRNFALILGQNGQLPVMVAAWTPPVAGLLLALGLILRMEEG